jgi:hypothetical protein
MAITRTAKGTAAGKTGTTTTITSVSLTAGDVLVIGYATDTSSGGGSSLTWNGHDLMVETTLFYIGSAPANNTEGYLVAWVVPASGTSDIVLTSASGKARALFATSINAVNTADKSAANGSTSTSTTPSSGATATTTAADEILIGLIATNGPDGDTAGSWSNSFNNGQRLGSTGNAASSNMTVSEGYLIVSATQTATAAKTGITARAWIGAVITLKNVVAVAPTQKQSWAIGRR